MPKPKQRGEDSDEISPQYKHARRLAQEAREAADAVYEVSREIEVVHDTRGRAKKREVITMSNGNKYRRPYNEAS